MYGDRSDDVRSLLERRRPAGEPRTRPGAGRLATDPSNRWPALWEALVAVPLSLATLPLFAEPSASLLPNAATWLAVAVATPVFNLTVIENRPEPEWTGRISRLNADQGSGWVGGLLAGAAWKPRGQRPGVRPPDVLRAVGGGRPGRDRTRLVVAVVVLGTGLSLLAWSRNRGPL